MSAIGVRATERVLDIIKLNALDTLHAHATEHESSFDVPCILSVLVKIADSPRKAGKAHKRIAGAWGGEAH